MMDDQILENFDVTAATAQIGNERINAPSVLRGIEGGSLHFITVPTGRDQEFIDHSLLNPEYITTHLPNGFIIDFMSSQDTTTTGNDEHQSHHHSSPAVATTATTHFITEQSAGAAVIQQHQQSHHQHQQQQSTPQQQHSHHQHQQSHNNPHHHHHHNHHIELQQHQNDDQDRKLTAAFLQFVNNKSYPVKIAANEAQVIVTNKDVLAQIEEASKHQQQHHHQNSVVVGQNLLSTGIIGGTEDEHHHEQHQTTAAITQSFLNDTTQYRLFESSPPQIQVNPSLPPLTPISRLTRSRNKQQQQQQQLSQGTVMHIQNSQIKTTTANHNFSIANGNFKNTDDIVIINDDIESPTNPLQQPQSSQLQQQQQQQRPLPKKNLPHKKRITKKLKIIDRIVEPQQQQQQTQQQFQQQQTPTIIDSGDLNAHSISKESLVASVFGEESNTITVPQFTCQLCGVGSDSQLEFFSHLKEHYEPETIDEEKKLTNDTTISLVQTSHPQTKEILVDNTFTVPNEDDFNQHQLSHLVQHHKKNEQETNHVIDNIKNQIQFHVETTITSHQQQQQQQTTLPTTIVINNDINDSLQHHTATTATTITSTNQQSQLQPPPPPPPQPPLHSSPSHSSSKDDLQGPEVEFSDTEDMLEGIRGVVDKVQESVDNDSNDCMNLISERSWYSNSALNGAVVTNPNLEEPQVDNFALFNRSDIEKLIEQQEQISLDNTSTNDIELPSANDLEVSMDSVEISQAPHSPETDHQEEIDFKEDLQNDIENDSKIISKRGRKPKTTKNSGGGKKRGNGNSKNSNEGKSKKSKNNNGNTGLDENIVDDEFKFKSKKKLQCSKCDKLFNSANALKYHDLSHTGERPHQCKICGKSFFAQSALKVHLRLHSGDKPYICEFCNRPFRQWGDLKYHTISIHTDMKSFQCEFCGKAFARRYSLVVHRRIHTLEKNYKCEFCPKSFRASSYLQNHRKIHTGEKPYMCKVCGKKFRVCGDLRRHENIHTRDKRGKTSSNGKNKNTTKNSKKQNSNKTSTIIQNENYEIDDIEDDPEDLQDPEELQDPEDLEDPEDKSDVKIEMMSVDPSSKQYHHSDASSSSSSHASSSHTNIEMFKTEPNFESSSSIDATTATITTNSNLNLNHHINVIELPLSTITTSSSSSTSSLSNRHQQQQQQQSSTTTLLAIPKRQIIKDNSNNLNDIQIKKDPVNNLDITAQQQHQQQQQQHQQVITTTSTMPVNKERFVYFW